MGGDKSMDTIPLSPRKWVSAPAFRYSVAGLLGVAGFVLGLVRDPKMGFLSGLPWLDRREDPPQEKLFFVPGLQNLGNNCFLNVILQALASCSSIQPFLRQVIVDCESSAVGESSESLQLTVSLASLLEDLCSCGKGKVVLSPRGVMLAMTGYIPNFNLTSQQDAEEAFLHLLSSLREEFSDCYIPSQCSLANALASPDCRILTIMRSEIQNEQERWQRHFLGPFDGILASTLTCQSCESQISLNFQFFHSLPLSPIVLEGAGIITIGCTLEDCLKQFSSAEKVENYNCSCCWHIAAIKYLSLKGVNKTEAEKLGSCTQHDSCTCHNLIDLESLPWSNNFSNTLKQLKVARCPKILSLHIQRAFVNQFGEVIKLEGHIRFPLVLNMLPFMLKELSSKKSSPYQKVHSEYRMLHQIYGQNSGSLIEDVFECNKNTETIPGGSILPDSKSILDDVYPEVLLETSSKVSTASGTVPQPHIYRLVSVVEHSGRAGGGHYTIYRSVRSKSQEQNPDENADTYYWFCISDSEVQRVSKEDVLAAEASLLFYEKVLDV